MWHSGRCRVGDPKCFWILADALPNFRTRRDPRDRRSPDTRSHLRWPPGGNAEGNVIERLSYPSIADYALIGDCHSSALVSRVGSVDWCCMPRFDSDSCFGRILDWDRGGYCAISPTESFESRRRYVGESLVLETKMSTETGVARVVDFYAHQPSGSHPHSSQLIRLIEGIEGHVDLLVEVVPRFDFGELRPWIRFINDHTQAAIGSDDGLLVWSDMRLRPTGKHEIKSVVRVRSGERKHLSVGFFPPEKLDGEAPHTPSPEECIGKLNRTLQWWQKWAGRIRLKGECRESAVRSAIVLKALTYAPTGAIVAAPTTSLPEAPGAVRNWDYRFSWIRDSVFTVRSLGSLGVTREAERFRHFVERSAAGSADHLQIMYRVDGNRRLPEFELTHLDGYRGARPVRMGNEASSQVQLDVYGELLELSWRWYERRRAPTIDYWNFLHGLVDVASRRWSEPDHGIWEVRGEPQHFVHSKVMCWVAVDRGIRLAEAEHLRAPLARWRRERDNIRRSVESRGYDARRGIFVRAFDDTEVDAALLLLPAVGFVDYRDDRMVRTVAEIRSRLEEGGLVARYRNRDGLSGREGTFLACSFWLAECLAYQGERAQAEEVFRRAASTANDLGLFAEEYDVESGEMTGNFPQGLTHMAHIEALVALAGSERVGEPVTAPLDTGTSSHLSK